MIASLKTTAPRALILGLALSIAACTAGIRDPQPADIPVLEQEVSQDPENLRARTQLGIAYFKADRLSEAHEQLALAVEAGSEEAATYLYLGLTNEEMEDWTSAREAYTRYLDLGQWDPLREELERRLVLIVRKELRTQAQRAIQQESQLAATPPEPRTVAVFPFQLVSDDEGLLPLQVAMADMMITDLSISNALTVLERTQIQTLLDEMAMTEAGYTDPGTGARAGRLLRAEHVVQGALTTLGDDQLRFDADVVNTESTSSAGDLSDQDQLEALFDMEKRVVFQVLDVLGAQLTPAEREAINENRSESILAFIAYGQGLMALDEGNYAGAQDFFQQAVNLDSGFDLASERVAEAGVLTEQDARTTDDVATRGSAELGGGVTGVGDATGAGQAGDVLTRTAQDVNPSRTTAVVDQGTVETGEQRQAQERDPTQEAARTETTTTTTATITIRISRPGGGGGSR